MINILLFVWMPGQKTHQRNMHVVALSHSYTITWLQICDDSWRIKGAKVQKLEIEKMVTHKAYSEMREKKTETCV